MKPTRRQALAALSGVLPACGSRGSRKANFLFLIADDHAGYVLGADGNRMAETPNLDRLAAEGTRFARHYCNSPVCSPSRQSFLSGQMPSSAGVTVLRGRMSEDKPTLAKQLKGAGYHTAVIGKMHFNNPARPGLYGFDSLLTEREWRQAYNSEVQPKPVPEDIAVQPPWRPFRDPASVWLNAEKRPYPRYDDDMPGTFLARKACEYLQEHRDGPFALWVSFHEPHSPFDFPVEYRPRFDPAQFPVPEVGPDDAWQVPLIFRELSPEQRQGIIAAYYTSTAFLDRNVGTVLDKLRELKLEDDTLVVYLPDHGYSLGQHGRFEKHCGYDPALRVPLIVRLPGRVRAGGVVQDFTESVDVAPTVLDVLGADPLPVQHGRSLRAYLEGGRPAQPRDHIFSQYLENEEGFIRTDRHKFIYCSGKRERTDGYKTDNPTPGRYVRMYDLNNDPGEFTDIAAKEPETSARLRGLLLQRFRDTHPEAGAVPADATPEEALDFFLRPRDAESTASA